MRFPLAVAILAVLPAVLTAAPAAAGDAAVELQRQADRVIGVLADRTAGSVVDRQREVRTIVTEAFDFDEASRRTLGRAWAERTPDERASFKALFVDLLDRAYLRRLDGWDGQRIVVGDEVLESDRATVRAAIVARDGDRTPMEYLMRRDGDGRWRVIDVNVGGASLLGNYRVQFARLIQTGGFPHLMEKLQAKVASLQP